MEGYWRYVSPYWAYVHSTYVSVSAKIPNQRAKDRVPPRKFSTLIKHMIVELDRDTTLYPDGNIVEVCSRA